MMITPCYEFDIRELTKQIGVIKNRFPLYELTYSIKANPFLLEYIIDQVKHVEVCSPGELEICISRKIPGNKIIYSGLLKEEHDIRRACEYGVDIITVESENQMLLIDKELSNSNKNVKVLLRLSSGNQFGMDINTIIRLVKNRQQYRNVEILGIHFFSGTQKNRAIKFQKDYELIKELAARCLDECDFKFKFLEYGPGLSVDYFVSTNENSNIQEDLIEEFSRQISELTVFEKIGVEFGRYIAASCGKYMTTVKDIKKSNEITYVIVDGGIHQLNYYGQIQGMKLPFISQNNFSQIEQDYCICGSLCTVADVLIRNVKLRKLNVGDILTFHKCGAYSVTESPVLFLSRDLPNIYVRNLDDSVITIREKKSSYDFNM